MIRCKVFEFKQGKDIFYLGLIKASEIIADCDVDIYDANKNPNGYQRRASLERAKRFSDYLNKCKGAFDSTCFLNVRDKKAIRVKNKKKLKNGINIVTLEIDNSLFIVDGQHRLKGLELATKGGFDKSFPVPVLITVGKKQPDEALSFLIINRTAKGIRADLTDELIYKTIKKEELTDDLKSVLGLTVQRNVGEFALNITEKVNTDTDSFWAGKIIRPNEIKYPEKTVNQRVFIMSLSDAIKSCSLLKRAANTGETELVVNLLKNYWQAIARICPKACSQDKWKKFSLIKRLGVMVMNQLFGRVLDDAGQDRSEEGLYRSLKKINSLTDYNWNAKEGRFGKLGTSYTAIKEVYTTLEMELDTASVSTDY